MTVVIMYSAAQSAPHAIDATTIYTPAALALAIALCILNPVLVLLNVRSSALCVALTNPLIDLFLITCCPSEEFALR